jgi:hypothetical protein
VVQSSRPSITTGKPLFTLHFISGARQRAHFVVRLCQRTAKNLSRAFYLLAHDKLTPM